MGGGLQSIPKGKGEVPSCLCFGEICLCIADSQVKSINWSLFLSLGTITNQTLKKKNQSVGGLGKFDIMFSLSKAYWVFWEKKYCSFKGEDDEQQWKVESLEKQQSWFVLYVKCVLISKPSAW